MFFLIFVTRALSFFFAAFAVGVLPSFSITPFFSTYIDSIFSQIASVSTPCFLRIACASMSSSFASSKNFSKSFFFERMSFLFSAVQYSFLSSANAFL